MKIDIASSALAVLAAIGTAQAAQTICSTQSGNKSVKKVPTSLIKTTSTATVTKPWSVTAKLTVTLSQSPVTVSSGNVSNVYITRTQTSIATVTNPQPTTVQATQLSFITVKGVATSLVYTATSTTTLSPSTSTVATPSGFVPAQSALQVQGSAGVQASVAAGASAGANVKRHIDAHIKAKAKAKAKKVKSPAKLYPTMVRCTVSASTSVFINAGAKPTLTITKTLPVSTTTVTVSGTGTIYQTASLTITTTIPISTKTKGTITSAATQTLYSTTTVSTVSIVTSTPAPLGFYYKACEANNLLDYTTDPTSGDQVAISNIDTDIENPTIQHVGSPQACCQNCITNSACDGAYYRSGFCFLLVDGAGQCAANASANAFATFLSSADSPGAAGSGLTVINGPCGTWKYGGSQ